MNGVNTHKEGEMTKNGKRKRNWSQVKTKRKRRRARNGYS